MKSIIICCSLLAAFVTADTIRMVPFEKVKMEDQLWNPEIRKLVSKTLPHVFKETEVGLNRLRMCTEYLEAGRTGPKPPPHPFNTSDLYKVMEGGAMMIQAEPNPEIEAQMDKIIAIIARAQQADGYLYVAHIIGNPTPGNMGTRPYSHVIFSHELYDNGHMYEAAVAYARATGKTKFLDVAEKSARHVNKVFFKYRDAKYIDVTEVVLLNNCLSGVGLDGTSFFYPNPLECDRNHTPRSGWFGCACCPSNIACLVQGSFRSRKAL